jgi:hypothetical protein
MKKVLLEEINRINELLGTKQKINEQLATFLKGLVPALRNDFLDAARTVFSGKLINKIDDLTEVEIAQVLKSSAAKMIRRNIFAEITNDLMMTAAKFSQKTSLELMQDLRTLGVKDPDFAAAYLKRFAKDNAVDTADKKYASVLASGGGPAPQPLPATGGRKKVDVDVDMTKKSSSEIADEIGKKYGKDRVQEFVDKLNVVGVDEQTKKIFLVDFKNYHDWTSTMLIAEFEEIKNQMSKNQLKSFNRILNFLGIKNLTIKGTSKTVLIIVVIMLGIWIIKNVNKVTGTSDELEKMNPFKGGESTDDSGDSEEGGGTEIN